MAVQDALTIGGRTYPFIPSGGPTGTLVKINDTAAPLLAHLADNFPGEFSRAVRHVGWRLRQAMVESAYHGSVVGHGWPPITDLQKQRVLDRARAEDAGGRMRKGLTPWHFGHIARAVAYKWESDAMRVRVGWLSRSSARLAAQVQAGFDTPVTPKMRKFFWAAGVKPPAGNTISSPPRPLVYPLFLASRAWIEQTITDRVFEILANAHSGARRAA
ncbi:MAG: hypothetical protein LDL07_14775 [Desulfarculus sp.]|nr:hypothetical protein [Desulfarculus sp.]